MFKNKKVLKTGVLSLAAVVLLTTGGYAAGKVYKRKVTATFGTINFEYEGKDVTKEIENLYNTPGFVMESRSYVPVRAIGDVLGVDVDYDVVTKTAKISDPKKADLDKKNGKIKELETENEKLKKEIESLKGGSSSGNTDKPIKGDLKSLERYLNNTYGVYRDIDFSYKLTEVSGDINIDMNVDFSNGKQYFAWNNMSSSRKEDIIKSVTDEVQKEFPNRDLEGRIYDIADSKQLASFRKRSGYTVRISLTGGSLDDDIIANDNVNSEVTRAFRYIDIDDARLVDLYKSSGRIYFTVDFSKDYKSKWNYATNSEVRSALDDIAREIRREYNDYNMDIDARVKLYDSGEVLADYIQYYGDSTGSVTKEDIQN